MKQQDDAESRRIVHRSGIRETRANPHQGSPVEFGRENAVACVSSCFTTLIPNVEDACRVLQQPEHQQAHLWDLYCCDSINCGVYIGGIGQSPNVDLIINECQNIGYFSVDDPGPPAIDYCASRKVNPIGTGSPLPVLTIAPTATANPRPMSIESLSPHTVITGLLSESSTPTSVSSISSTTTSLPTSTDAKKSHLTSGSKVAIGVLSAVAVLAVAALFIYLLRRRRQTPIGRSSRPFFNSRDTRSYPGPPSDSHSPLITAIPFASPRGAPLAPPARLSDRRYIHPVLRRNISQPLASTNLDDRILPLPSTTSDKRTNSTPQHKRQLTGIIRFSRSASSPAQPHYPPSSVYSANSERYASAVTIGSNKANSTHSYSVSVTGTSTPPLRSPGLPRAYSGATLESPGFVTPAGPPPTRALPAPPTDHPKSPTFPVSSTSPRSATFPTQSFTHVDTSTPTRASNRRDGIDPAANKDLCELNEAYSRNTRESWGSWSGVGGGGPGVTPPGRKRGSAEKKGGERRTAVALQELDLEKLGGRY